MIKTLFIIYVLLFEFSFAKDPLFFVGLGLNDASHLRSKDYDNSLDGISINLFLKGTGVNNIFLNPNIEFGFNLADKSIFEKNMWAIGYGVYVYGGNFIYLELSEKILLMGSFGIKPFFEITTIDSKLGNLETEFFDLILSVEAIGDMGILFNNKFGFLFELDKRLWYGGSRKNNKDVTINKVELVKSYQFSLKLLYSFIPF